MKNLLIRTITSFSIVVLMIFSAYGQEGTKQLMPNSNDRLWLEFKVFDGNDFGLYNCEERERINIYLRDGEIMHFGMKLSESIGTNYWIVDDPNDVYFRIKDPSGTVVYPETRLGDILNSNGYIADYTQAVTGPNGVVLNGTTISGGYDALTYTAQTDGNHFIEFRETGGTGFDRFALEFFDVTVTNASNNVITNPGEPNKSAGRLWSKGWSFTTTSFTEYPVNASFHVYTSDEFINKVNFKMYPYSFAFVVNSYGVTTFTEENYIRRTQSLEGDQTSDDDISEYRVFLNDPDRQIWPNTTLVPPEVTVHSEDTLFMDYDYNRDPLYLPLDINRVVMEKNMPSCTYDDVAIFEIETNNDGYTAIMIDVDGDGSYSTGGSDRVIYREMRKGLNYVLWDFKTDAGAEVAVGDYTASATFFGRGPAHFPLYDVEQMDGITTSSIRPFNKLNTTIYWDDTQITNWGDQDGGDLMDETQQKQLKIGEDVPRTWSWHGDMPNTAHNGNLNTLNTWFNAIDLGYSDIGLHVQESTTKCVDGTAPWVGDIYKEGPKDTDMVFSEDDFTYKYFHPLDLALSSIEVMNLPAEGNLYLSGTPINAGDQIAFADLGNITYTPESASWTGKASFDWRASDGTKWSNNSEKIYLIINTPPEISDIPDQTLCTNVPTAPIDFTVTDDESDAGDIEVTAFSADPTFVPNDGIVIGGSGENRTVTVTPVANKSGMAIIYIMADDGLIPTIEQFTVYVGPDLEFSGDTTVCVGDPLYLIAQEVGATYSWKYEGTEVSSTQSVQQTAGNVDVGQWSLTVSNDGCTSTRYFNVAVSPLTTFDGDVDVCIGEEISLSATEVNAVYSWMKGGTEVSDQKIFSIASAATSDAGNDYTLFVDKDGCQNTSDPFEITVVNSPNAGLTVTGNTVDPGQQGTITISSAQAGVTYNVYQESSLIATGSGGGSDLTIDIDPAYLEVGANEFTIGANNGNCEVELNETATITVNTPGVTVSSISGNTSEDGTTASFTIVLDTEPLNNVTIDLTSGDLSEGTISPASVTFTPSNYDVPQSIIVTGVDDDIIDGSQVYTIQTAAAVSADTYYNGIDPDDVVVTNDDNDVASVEVSPTTGLVTTEAGGTDNFTIVLTAQPQSEVTINLSSSNTDEGTVSPTSVIFDDTNWNTPQSVTVTGVDDAIDDDSQDYTIITSLTSSLDSDFEGLLVSDVQISNSDDDNAGITVTPISGLSTSEAGASDNFSVVLESEPTANVTISFLSGDASEASVSPQNVTFTASDWNSPQQITVSGVDDDIDDDEVSFNIITNASVSTDNNYNGINPPNVSGTNIDNDLAGITVSPASGLITSEDNGTDVFNVHLDTEPVSDVTIDITSEDLTEGTVSPASITFTAADWSDDQLVTITGVDDDMVDGDVNYNVNLSVSAGDAKYTALADIPVSATNTDNDIAGVSVTPTSIGTTEGGGTGTFSLVLTSMPSADVTIAFSGVDGTEGTIDQSAITFIPSEWDVSQDVTVTGEDDEIQDGNITYTVATTASSADGMYEGVAVDDIQVTNADDDVAGITVTPESGLITTEAGGEATFQIALNTQPTADVSISLSSSDGTEGSVSPASVVFTNADWSAQTITVTGLDDAIDDGDVGYTVSTSNSSSSDGNYNEIDVADVAVTNTDDDVAGINVSPTTGLQTTEAGGTASFDVVLESEPTGTITIGISSDDTNEGTVSSSSISFNNGNWNLPQTITLTGQDDAVDDGDVSYNITLTVSSGDAEYLALSDIVFSALNLDDDNAGITVNAPADMETTEAGGTVQFTMVLDSEPTADVSIGLSSGNATEGQVNPSSLTFSATNWNTPQTVTVTGQDDWVDDGDVLYSINIAAVTSSDANYVGIDPTDLSITNLDDDDAGVSVNPISGLETTEAGGTASFDVVLDTKPVANVVIEFASDNTNEGVVDLNDITFTATNWNTPRTITITGVDDAIDDGNVGYWIETSVQAGADTKYNALDPSDVSVTNMDDDNAGVTVTAAPGLETTEAGGTASFSLVLDTEPVADVQIDLTSSDLTEGSLSIASVVFTSANWNVAQEVTVTGVDDDLDDGDIGYSIITEMATGGDANYNALNPADVNVTNLDDDEAGVTVDPYAGLYTVEDGTTAQFNIRLNTEPTDSVVIDLQSSDLTEGTVDKTMLVFKPANWSVNQTVTITGVDDDMDDTDIAYSIETNARTSDDPLYSEIFVRDVSVTNQDDDTWGFTVNPQELTYNENGTDKDFTIVLNSEPLNNVTIGISSEEPLKGTVSTASLEFTPSNWDEPQTVTVSPVDNDIDDGDTQFLILTANAVSTDGNYDGKNPSDVTVNSIDDDVAEIQVTEITGNTSEDLTTATFSIVLASEPTGDVTIGLSSSNEGEGTLSTSEVIFTPSNWDTPVTVAVTGEDDAIADGNQTYYVEFATTVSTDSNYDGVDLPNIEVVNADNDSPGVTVFPISGLTTDEAAATASFTVRLNSQPTASVSIGVSSSDPGEGTVAPGSLVFTTGNWDEEQTVTITGVDDLINDGDQAYTIELADAISTDGNYNGFAVQNVAVTNLDDVGPRAADDNIPTDEDTDININVLANDLGLDDGGLVVTITTEPANGSATVEADNTITYAPNGLYNGVEIFTYQVEDADGDVDEATVSVNVTGLDDFPVAVGDSRGTSMNVDVTVDVLFNDYGLEDGGIVVAVDEAPFVTEGTASVNPDNTVSFTPATDYTGVVQFIYRVSDTDGDSDTAIITINVHEVNATPDAIDDNVETDQNSDVDINVLENDTGLEDGFGSLQVYTQPDSGTVTVIDRIINYTPDNDFTGYDEFVYFVEDVDGDYDTARVTVFVKEIPGYVPVAVDDAGATEYETPININVLANDLYLNDGVQSVSISSVPVNGACVVESDFSITYTPDAGYSGIEVFSYQVCDSDGDCATASVTIEVLEDGVPNYVPLANGDDVETQVNTSVDVNVLDNDTGLEDGFGSIQIQSQPLFGSVTVNANRTVTYTPSNWYLGGDQFIYRLEDIHGDADTAIVNVTVTETPDYIPVANDDSRATEYETPVIVDVLTNDIGLEDGVASVAITTLPSNGNAVVNPDFTVTYTPNAGYEGMESFDYEVCDNDGDCATATVSIEVLEDGIVNYIPDAVDDAVETSVNISIDINVLDNDTGLDDGFGDLQIYSSAAHGSLTVNSNHTITYNPSPWFVGSDAFKYWVEDIHGDYDTATVVVTVTETPDYIPVANDDSRATEYETAVTIDVLLNDTGLEDGVASLALTAVPTNGNAVVNPDFTVTYTPNAGYEGMESFDYEVCDADGDCASARVVVEVLEDGVVNYVPNAEDDNAETMVNTSVDINVLDNDTGLEDGFGSLQIYAAASHGSLTVNSNHTITYTPSSWYVGSDAFKYLVEDVHGDLDTATVLITVTEVPNYIPVANDDSRATEYETPIDVNVLVNDTGLEDGVASVALTALPTNGNAVVNPDFTVTYTPNAGYEGMESFDYEVCDNDGDCATATVSIEVLEDGIVNYIPDAVDDAVETSVNIRIDINVLDNDTGLDDGFGDLQIYSSAAHGSLTVNSNHTITYNPSPWFVGSDVFKYWVEDIHGDYDTATVAVTVTETPDYIPVANDDSRATEYETAVTIDVLLNDTGLEDGVALVALTAVPTNGNAVVNPDFTVTYTPNAGYEGMESFDYEVCDADGDCASARVVVEVLEDGVVNYIPNAEDDNAETMANTSVDINVLDNDTGLDDGFGSLQVYTAASHGSLTVNSNHTITYTPSSWYVGSDAFKYLVEDVHGDLDTATVLVTVTDVPNYIPVANDDSRATEYETAIDVNVLVNDTGLEDGVASVAITTLPSNGNAVVNPDFTVTYTPNAGYDGMESFDYEVCDNDGDCATARVNIEVLEDGVSNHIPVAENDTVEVLVNETADINVLNNDSGLEDGFGALSILTQADFGTATVQNRTIEYTPSPWFVGEDSFQYLLEDVHGDYDIATVYITVTDKPDYQPVANADRRGTEYETQVVVDVLVNDTGLEDGGLNVSIESDPVQGTATANADNTVTFTPAAEFAGEMTFQYRVTDIDGDFSVADVTITVKEDGVTNHIPDAIDDNVLTYENTAVDINVLANDKGLDDGFGDIMVIEGPQHGDVIVHENRTITYTPSPWYVGTDEFKYWIEDIDGDYDIATVDILVTTEGNHFPQANDDARGTEYETTVVVDVLTNDTGLEDGGIIVDLKSAASHGEAISNMDNTISYTPENGFAGTDEFWYYLSDTDADLDSAMVTINVKEEGVPNFIPDAVYDNAETYENTPVAINVLANDAGLEDGFGDLLIFEEPLNGTVVVNENRTITYNPANAYIGSDQFKYWVEDVDGDYDTATVYIAVVERPNIIPVAVDDRRGTEYETAVNVDVLINDTNLDDGGIIVNIATAPDHGTAVVNPDNTVRFTPANGFAGLANFEYRLEDANGDADTALVTITVKEEGVENHIPDAVDDVAETVENTPVDIVVLANDRDLDDGFGDISIYTGAANGSLHINDDRTITYTPSYWFIGTDSFEYWIEDVDGDYDIAKVEITVNERPNYIPQAEDDYRGVTMNESVDVDVLYNDTGLEDGGLSLTIVETSENGTAIVNADNTITFTPEDDYLGMATFSYQVCDIDMECSEALVTITVKENNHVPVAEDDKAYTSKNTAVAVEVLANDSGMEDGGLALSIAEAPLYGSVAINADHTITYTPINNYVGSDVFTYTLTDAEGDFDEAKVRIGVVDGLAPGITVEPLVVETGEDGTSGSFSIVLNTVPYEEVRISIASTNESEAIPGISELVFNATNWNVPQDVNVSGIDDDVDDGDQRFMIITGFASSADTIYNNLNVKDVSAVNFDDDEAGIVLDTHRGETSELGDNAVFKFVLNSEPLSEVTLDVSSSDVSEGETSTVQLLFTPDNWSDTSELTVYGIDDIEVDGDVEYTVSIAASVSDDPNYNEIALDDLSLVNKDNDFEGLFVPDAFSPDNDGYNDVFTIGGMDKYDRVSIRIYNRWGNLVYSSDNYDNSWDGRTNTNGSLGKVMSTGTYFYVIEIKDTGEELSGSIYLKR